MLDINFPMKEILKDHKITAAESRSWYIGKPGTTANSFHVTWSPGLLTVYRQSDSVTLIDKNMLKTFQATCQWIASCDIDSFKTKISLYDDGSVSDYFELLKFWNSQTHYI